MTSRPPTQQNAKQLPGFYWEPWVGWEWLRVRGAKQIKAKGMSQNHLTTDDDAVPPGKTFEKKKKIKRKKRETEKNKKGAIVTDQKRRGPVRNTQKQKTENSPAETTSARHNLCSVSEGWGNKPKRTRPKKTIFHVGALGEEKPPRTIPQ